jgi:hypothetical protein
MFNTKGVDTTEKSFGSSQFITYGNQELAISGYEIREASTGKKQVMLKFETPKVVEDGFEPHEDSKIGGRIGKVQFTIYMDESDGESTAVKEFIKNIGIVADKLNIRDKVDAITSNSLEEYMDKFVKLARGQFAYWSVTGEQYEAQTGDGPKARWSLRLRRFGFIASKEEGIDHLQPFNIKNDPNNYDLKYLAKADDETDAPDDFNDLPFDTDSETSNSPWE